MVKTKQIAKRGESSKSKKNAESESSRRELSDGDSDQTLPRNDLPPHHLFQRLLKNSIRSTLLKKRLHRRKAINIKEPLLTEKMRLKESLQHRVEEIPLSIVVADKEVDPSEEKNQSEAESESAQKVEESDKNEGVVSVGSSSEDISIKEGRKKRVLNDWGYIHQRSQRRVPQAHRLNLTHFLQPEDAAKSPFLAQGRLKKSSEPNADLLSGVTKKRYDQFLKRKVIDERLVDMVETD
ncbi:hypothetical protein DY000_02054088 [Brassica cretica]|uniref:Ribosome biogenesis protein NOP53 n=1 Tax=Brassica cretica TaxID=69181 RepID=A0ABQ7AMI7_BRACR|nr:hypothetical protein DY000_02054088 [Brassica cretica]